MKRVNQLLARPKLLAAIAGGTLLVFLWIGWTIYVATNNGWTAAVGVLISWPLLAAIAVAVAMAVIGATRLVQERRSPRMPVIAGAGPPPKLPRGHDSVTTVTFPS